ncbi:hypothetical protein BC835DRAFT_1412949 [Cytidiella melzeri]|nr:hypothetical protein BC835DRAFT_1412949 [Cytidiella melzeri]
MAPPGLPHPTPGLGHPAYGFHSAPGLLDESVSLCRAKQLLDDTPLDANSLHCVRLFVEDGIQKIRRLQSALEQSTGREHRYYGEAMEAKQRYDNLAAEFQDLKARAMMPNHLPPFTGPNSAIELAPSDSASRFITPEPSMLSRSNIVPPEKITVDKLLALTPESLECQTLAQLSESRAKPADMPDSVLWTKDSRKGFGKAAGVYRNNEARTTAKCLRWSDGRELERAERLHLSKAIKGTARKLLKVMEQCKEAKGGQDMPNTVRYYTTECEDAWNGALAILEEIHPILRLCGDHYKAAYFLSAVLQPPKKKGKAKSRRPPRQAGSEPEDEDDDEDNEDDEDDMTNDLASSHTGATVHTHPARSDSGQLPPPSHPPPAALARDPCSSTPVFRPPAPSLASESQSTAPTPVLPPATSSQTAHHNFTTFTGPSGPTQAASHNPIGSPWHGYASVHVQPQTPLPSRDEIRHTFASSPMVSFTIQGQSMQASPMKAPTKRGPFQLSPSASKRNKTAHDESAHFDSDSSPPSSPHLPPAFRQGTLSSTAPPSTSMFESALPSGRKIVDLSHISVPSSFTGLTYLETQDLSIRADIIDEIKALVGIMGEHPNHKRSSPDMVAKAFLHLLKTADPNSQEYDDEDNNDTQWGHAMYSSHLGPAIKDWTIIGNTGHALELLSVGIKIAEVARQLCHSRNVPAPSRWIADDYLERLVGGIKKAWLDAGGEAPKPAASAPAAAPAAPKPRARGKKTGAPKATRPDAPDSCVDPAVPVAADSPADSSEPSRAAAATGTTITLIKTVEHISQRLNLTETLKMLKVLGKDLPRSTKRPVVDQVLKELFKEKPEELLAASQREYEAKVKSKASSV